MIFLFQCQFFVHEAQSSFARVFRFLLKFSRWNVIEAVWSFHVTSDWAWRRLAQLPAAPDNWRTNDERERRLIYLRDCFLRRNSIPKVNSWLVDAFAAAFRWCFRQWWPASHASTCPSRDCSGWMWQRREWLELWINIYRLLTTSPETTANERQRQTKIC